VAGLGVLRQDFQLVSGRELIKCFEAPVRQAPPAYHTAFCSRCGSPVPDVNSDTRSIEVPAGLLDDDPQLRPDKHIYVEAKPLWFTITDNLPQLDHAELVALRQAQPPA
jgi:hypothetical protein